MVKKQGFSVSGSLGESFSVYFNNFFIFLLINTVYCAPFVGAAVFAFSNKTQPVPAFAGILLASVIMLIGMATQISAISMAQLTGSVSLAGSLSNGFSKSIRMAAAICLYAFSSILGLFLLLFPGLYWITTRYFAMESAVLEEKQTSPLGTSAMAVKGHFWQVFMTALLLYAPTSVYYMFFRENISKRVFSAGFIIYCAILFLLSPLLTAIKVVFYNNLKSENGVKPEETKGLPTFAGCLIALLIYGGIVGGIVALAMTAPGVRNLLFSSMTNNGKFINGAVIQPEEGWNIMPAGAKGQKVIMIQKTPCPGVMMVKVSVFPWSELGLKEEELTPDNTAIAEKLRQKEQDQYDTVKYRQLADRYAKLRLVGVRSIKPADKGWAFAEFESKDGACAALTREFWKLYYTVQGDYITVVSYDGTDYTDQDIKAKAAATEASVLAMIAKSKFPEAEADTTQ